MLNILVIDDDKSITKIISKALECSGYGCTVASDGEEGKRLFNSGRWDLVLLDVMLPKVSGYELLEYIKPTKTAIIVLSGLDQLSTRIRILKMGADDYISKPFQLDELLARIDVVIRRANIKEETFEHDEVKVNFNSRKVTRKGKEVLLTMKEFELLRLFVYNKNVALERNFLFENVWHDKFNEDSRTLDNHVKSLRKKLGFEDVIQTIFRIGYRLKINT
ncbi:MAG: response regulator transcription factor [Eubacterium sp.]|nr:response regulator transcription factor [Eubacterium sp.]